MKTQDKPTMDSRCWWSCNASYNAGNGYLMLGPLVLIWYSWLGSRSIELYWRDRLIASR